MQRVGRQERQHVALWQRKPWRFLVGVVVALSVVGIVQPAQAEDCPSANSCNLQETNAYNTVIYWTTARTNSHTANIVTWEDEGNTAGGWDDAAIRPASGGATYARASSGGYGVVVAMTDDATGADYVPAGTFYLSTEAIGSCGAECPGDVATWEAVLTWNIPDS